MRGLAESRFSMPSAGDQGGEPYAYRTTEEANGHPVGRGRVALQSSDSGRYLSGAMSSVLWAMGFRVTDGLRQVGPQNFLSQGVQHLPGFDDLRLAREPIRLGQDAVTASELELAFELHR